MPVEDEDDPEFDEPTDEKPTVVVLKAGDLTADEANEAQKEAGRYYFFILKPTKILYPLDFVNLLLSTRSTCDSFSLSPDDCHLQT